MTYDLDSETSTILDDALPQMTLSADGLPGLISWGLPGIVVFTNDPSDASATLQFYDTVNGSSQIARFPDREAESVPLTNPLWVTITHPEASRDVTVVQMGDYAWDQFDPVTNEITGLGTRLEAASAAKPEQSLRLVWDIYAADTSAWTLLTADGTDLVTWTNSQDLNTSVPFAIAPDGQAAAFLQDDILILWQDGATKEIAFPPDLHVTGLYWGPAHWQAGAAYDGVG